MKVRFGIFLLSNLSARMLAETRGLTAPHGPVLHWCDWLRGRLFRVLGEDGKGLDSLERDGHWDMAQSCSVAGRSSGSHSLVLTSCSLKLTQRTCRVVLPWPHVTEHCNGTHTGRERRGHAALRRSFTGWNWRRRRSSKQTISVCLVLEWWRGTTHNFSN